MIHCRSVSVIVALVAFILLCVGCSAGFDTAPAGEPTPTCTATSVEAGALAYVCPGTNPIVVTCDGAIEQRSEIDPVVGSLAECVASAWGDNIMCCYAPVQVAAPVDRACTADERGYVTAAVLALDDCTEIVNRSGVVGGRVWCCVDGAL